MKTPEKATSVGYRCTSYLTGIDSGTEFSSWPCLRSFRFGGVCHNVRPLSTLGGAHFRAPWAGRDFSNRSRFSLADSTTVFNLLEISLRPLSRLYLWGGVAGGSPKSKRAHLISTRFFKRRESVKVIGGWLLSFLFPIFTIYCWARKCLNFRPTRHWQRPFARAASAPFLSEESWESKLIVLTTIAFTNSGKVVAGGA